MAEQIIFYILAFVMVLFSIMAVVSKRIIRAATYLLFVLIATAGIYLLLNYHFLFAVQIAVYAGGIMVLFIMAIFLTHKPGNKIQRQSNQKVLLTTLLSVVGVAITGFIIVNNITRVYNYVAQTELNMKDVGASLMGYEKYQYVLPFEVVSVLLLACIIGAVIIARPEVNEEKQQKEIKEGE